MAPLGLVTMLALAVALCHGAPPSDQERQLDERENNLETRDDSEGAEKRLSDDWTRDTDDLMEKRFFRNGWERPIPPVIYKRSGKKIDKELAKRLLPGDWDRPYRPPIWAREADEAELLARRNWWDDVKYKTRDDSEGAEKRLSDDRTQDADDLMEKRLVWNPWEHIQLIKYKRNGKKIDKELAKRILLPDHYGLPDGWGRPYHPPIWAREAEVRESDEAEMLARRSWWDDVKYKTRDDSEGAEKRLSDDWTRDADDLMEKRLAWNRWEPHIPPIKLYKRNGKKIDKELAKRILLPDHYDLPDGWGRPYHPPIWAREAEVRESDAAEMLARRSWWDDVKYKTRDDSKGAEKRLSDDWTRDADDLMEKRLFRNRWEHIPPIKYKRNGKKIDKELAKRILLPDHYDLPDGWGRPYRPPIWAREAEVRESDEAEMLARRGWWDDVKNKVGSWVKQGEDAIKHLYHVPGY